VLGTVNVIFVVPNESPVTKPLEDPTVATPLLELVHVPPGTDPVSVVVEPIHIPVIPDIVGATFVITDAVAGDGHELTPFTVTETEYPPAVAGGLTVLTFVVVLE